MPFSPRPLCRAEARVWDAAGKPLAGIGRKASAELTRKSVDNARALYGKWHDGQELTADDVAFTIQSVNDPQKRYQNRTYIAQVVKVEALDK